MCDEVLRHNVSQNVLLLNECDCKQDLLSQLIIKI